MPKRVSKFLSTGTTVAIQNHNYCYRLPVRKYVHERLWPGGGGYPYTGLEGVPIFYCSHTKEQQLFSLVHCKETTD